MVYPMAKRRCPSPAPHFRAPNSSRGRRHRRVIAAGKSNPTASGNTGVLRRRPAAVCRAMSTACCEVPIDHMGAPRPIPCAALVPLWLYDGAGDSIAPVRPHRCL